MHITFDFFVGIMLICFGAAWPFFLIYRTWKTKTAKGLANQLMLATEIPAPDERRFFGRTT